MTEEIYCVWWSLIDIKLWNMAWWSWWKASRLLTYTWRCRFRDIRPDLSTGFCISINDQLLQHLALPTWQFEQGITEWISNGGYWRRRRVPDTWNESRSWRLDCLVIVMASCLPLPMLTHGFSFTPFLSDPEASATKPRARTVEYLSQIKRILSPGPYGISAWPSFYVQR